MVDAQQGATRRIRVSRPLVEESAEILRSLSGGVREAVILWVGATEPGITTVSRIVVPEQDATAGHFDVPLPARLRLIAELAANGEVLLAQVHTHPLEAFHSPVDDRLAVPRQTGAISIVVPYFGTAWTGELAETSVNQHLGQGRWREVSAEDVLEVIA